MTNPAWVHGPIRVMPYGDARVTGIVASDSNAGWRADLESGLGGYGALCGPTRDSPWPAVMYSRYHGGISGLTASTAETRIYSDVSTHTPRLIVLSVGLEDLIVGTSSSDILNSIDRAIGLACAARPGVSFLWLTPSPLIGSYAAYDSERTELAEDMPARALEHLRQGRDVTVVEAGEAITNTATQMATDINPNATGYGLMGVVIAAATTAWLRRVGIRTD